MVKRDKLFGLLKENAGLMENLTNTQNRCSGLLREARDGKRLVSKLLEAIDQGTAAGTKTEHDAAIAEARDWAATPL